jgi:hypothetical protein
MKKIRVLVLKHFAPMQCIGYKDPLEFLANLISRDNICILQFLVILAKGLVEEAGGVWTEEMKEFVFHHLGFTDMMVVVAYDKYNPEPEFHTAAKKMGISLSFLRCVGFLFMRAQVYHYNLHHPDRGPLPVLCASSHTNKHFFDGKEISESEVLDAKDFMHGQVPAMGEKALGNVLVWSNDKIQCRSNHLSAHYRFLMAPMLSEEVQNRWPEQPILLLQIAGRDGHKMTSSMIEARVALMIQQCMKNGRKGRKMVQDACRAFVMNEDMTETQIDIVVGVYAGGDVVKQAFIRWQLGMPLLKEHRKIIDSHLKRQIKRQETAEARGDDAKVYKFKCIREDENGETCGGLLSCLLTTCAKCPKCCKKNTHTKMLIGQWPIKQRSQSQLNIWSVAPSTLPITLLGIMVVLIYAADQDIILEVDTFFQLTRRFKSIHPKRLIGTRR